MTTTQAFDMSNMKYFARTKSLLPPKVTGGPQGARRPWGAWNLTRKGSEVGDGFLDTVFVTGRNLTMAGTAKLLADREKDRLYPS